MTRVLRGVAAACAVVLSLAMPVRAQQPAPSGFEALWHALEMSDLLSIMRTEGLEQSESLGFDYLPYAPGAGWAEVTRRIYDTRKMETEMRRAFSDALGPESVAEMVAFFNSEDGREIIAREVRTRREFLDPGKEASAREAVTGQGAETARMAQVEAYIDVNDLVEYNVTAALNSNFRFYQGLSEGGALDMTEAEMLDEVWSQEALTRADTDDWLRAFLHAAYAPLDDAQMDAYIAFSRTPAGQRLNRALFEGFAVVYDEIHYALGLAIADRMASQEL